MNEKMSSVADDLAMPLPVRLEKCLEAYRQVIEMFGHLPLIAPGRIQILDWDLDYVHGLALASFIDQILIRRLNDFTPDNDHPLILDCGANIGFSVLNYKRQFPKSRIVAFEPDPKFTPVLQRNLIRNGVAGIQVIEAAVWIKNGEARWLCEGIDGSKIVFEDQGTSDTIIVPTIDLADYLHEVVDLVKMDIEGAEYDVICHLGHRLRMVKNMSIECHLNQSMIKPFSRMLDTLIAAGFKLGINSFGPWRDLIRQPAKPTPAHWEQYLVVAAWRDLRSASIDQNTSPSPYIDPWWQQRSLELSDFQKRWKATQAELEAIQMELKRYKSSRLAQIARKIGGW